jgi:hypothetical protein
MAFVSDILTAYEGSAVFGNAYVVSVFGNNNASAGDSTTYNLGISVKAR